MVHATVGIRAHDQPGGAECPGRIDDSAARTRGSWPEAAEPEWARGSEAADLLMTLGSGLGRFAPLFHGLAMAGAASGHRRGQSSGMAAAAIFGVPLMRSSVSTAAPWPKGWV